MSAAQKGRKQSPEQRAANGLRKKAAYQNDPSFRAKALAALERGRANPENARRRIAAVTRSSRNRVWSDASRRKLSDSRKGMRLPDDAIQRMRMKKFKPVICSTLDMEFGCVDEAAIRIGLSVQSIYNVCNGRQKAVDGLSFHYQGATPCSL
jgi:hypothetical protein